MRKIKKKIRKGIAYSLHMLVVKLFTIPYKKETIYNNLSNGNKSNSRTHIRKKLSQIEQKFTNLLIFLYPKFGNNIQRCKIVSKIEPKKDMYFPGFFCKSSIYT